MLLVFFIIKRYQEFNNKFYANFIEITSFINIFKKFM